MAEFPFTWDLPQGSGTAEYKQESEPYPWKVDVWNDCRVTFRPSGGLGASLEDLDDGEILIERGYTYLFGLADETPAPAPEPPQPPPAPMPTPTPQPEPTPTPIPTPIPPPLPSTMPWVTGIYGAPVTQPLYTFWGITDAVWTVPEAWYKEAWARVREALIDRIADAVERGDYDTEHHTRG